MTGGNGNKRALHFLHPPQRVVSLVPSLTESLFDLGFGRAVVGVTDYCSYPQNQLEMVTRIGGPKNPDLDMILDLNPDLVIANQEENEKSVVEFLEERGAPVWVTFPKTVRQAMDVLWTLVDLFNSRPAAMKVATLEHSLDWVEGSLDTQSKVRYFCPIWEDHPLMGLPWWMTFNERTYVNDLLRLFGGLNVFADRERRYPLDADLGLMGAEPAAGRDVRYPRVTQSEIIEADPEIILLPSEPFSYSKEHLEDFAKIFPDVNAVKSVRIHLVDGSLLTWHGTRLAKALVDLPMLFESEH